MSFKEITTEQRVCDWCGKPMDDQVEGITVRVALPTSTQQEPKEVFVRVMVGSFDLHVRCQWEAIAEAARQVGTRKPRGRAAKKGGVPGGAQIEGVAEADSKVPGDQPLPAVNANVVLPWMRPATPEEAATVTP